MDSVLDTLLILVLLLNFFLLGSSQLKSAIDASAPQGALLGLATLFVHKTAFGELELEHGLIALGAALIKGLLIPTLLRRALRDAAIRREMAPVIGFIPCLLLGALGTSLA